MQSDLPMSKVITQTDELNEAVETAEKIYTSHVRIAHGFRRDQASKRKRQGNAGLVA